MSTSGFPVVDVLRARDTLLQLHEQVVLGHRRIELHTEGIDGTSVIISKTELESMERALAILGDAACVKELCKSLQKFALAAVAPHLPPPVGAVV